MVWCKKTKKKKKGERLRVWNWDKREGRGTQIHSRTRQTEREKYRNETVGREMSMEIDGRRVEGGNKRGDR